MLSAYWTANFVVKSLRSHIDLNFSKALFTVAKVVAGREDNICGVIHAKDAVSCILFIFAASGHASKLVADLVKNFLLDLLCLFAFLAIVIFKKETQPDKNAAKNCTLN
jgi:hypothetical protein